MPGTLYVVATPIGNLEDITLRALRVLREADLIAAEDTRRTARLLQHYSIATPTTSLHEHNESQRAAELLERLRHGASVALVSDAGTPLVSDPGARLVRAVRTEGFRVVPIPGPSAVTAALAALGLPNDEFTFLGFPPSRSRARQKWFEEVVAGSPRSVVLFEAPHRVRRFLHDAAAVLGNRPIAVARELTKLHEELVVRPINELLLYFADPKGEFTIVIPPGQSAQSEVVQPSADDLRRQIGDMTDKLARSKRQAVAAVARQHGLSTNALYKLLAGSDE
jgi:16S rRNA (cytidine1402-2'-O)-methyltransferase